MIKIKRGPEPVGLAAIRATRLAELRALGRDPLSTEIDGYRYVAEDLWKSQYHKCCYCEHRVPMSYNDVEHYRPKAKAVREPGCVLTHGYWWLAFTWENLLYACADCNRSQKNSKFPLDLGCQSLTAETAPPGGEKPLLINPAETVNPVEHIEFVHLSLVRGSPIRTWWAIPRSGSVFGSRTIEVCGLNRSELRELREDHFEMIVTPQFRAIDSAINAMDKLGVIREFDRALGLLEPRNAHVGLSYDALRHLIPDARLKKIIGTGWPKPKLIAI